MGCAAKFETIFSLPHAAAMARSGFNRADQSEKDELFPSENRAKRIGVFGRCRWKNFNSPRFFLKTANAAMRSRIDKSGESFSLANTRMKTSKQLFGGAELARFAGLWRRKSRKRFIQG